MESFYLHKPELHVVGLKFQNKNTDQSSFSSLETFPRTRDGGGEGVLFVNVTSKLFLRQNS